MIQIWKGPAAHSEHQKLVPSEAGAASDAAQEAGSCLIYSATDATFVTLDIGTVGIAFNADDELIDLPIVACMTAD